MMHGQQNIKSEWFVFSAAIWEDRRTGCIPNTICEHFCSFQCHYKKRKFLEEDRLLRCETMWSGSNFAKSLKNLLLLPSGNKISHIICFLEIHFYSRFEANIYPLFTLYVGLDFRLQP
jgi:hypothetical protein